MDAMKPGPRWLAVMAVVAIALLAVTDASVVAIVAAVGVGYLIFKVGFAMLGGLAQPVPEPPPPGELRKVKIQFRCSICGTEVRMTNANDEMPEPPKHCLEEMDLVAPVE